MEFSVDGDGHSNIESSESEYEQVIVSMESPKVTVWAVSRDRATYNVYIEEDSGLLDIPSHGILGESHVTILSLCILSHTALCILSYTAS